MHKNPILFLASLTSLLLIACQAQDSNQSSKTQTLYDTEMELTSRDYPDNPKDLTEAQWKELLTETEYRVLRQDGTERAGTGQLDKHYEEGVYVCAACGTPLFTSETKFNSRSGWPSFFAAIAEGEDNPIEYVKDTSHGMTRVEVRCKKCDSHLGHVFYGEKFGNPVDARYCINSVSLDFVEADNKEAKASDPETNSIETQES